MIKIIVDDITTLEVDAIVNAANCSLLGGGGVDGTLLRLLKLIELTATDGSGLLIHEHLVDVSGIDCSLQSTGKGVPLIGVQTTIDEVGHVEEGSALLHLLYDFLSEPTDLVGAKGAHITPGGNHAVALSQ